MVKFLIVVLVITIVGLLVWKFVSPYFVRIDNVLYVSGAPGTGKDVLCSQYALARYRVAYRKFAFNCFLRKLHLTKKVVEEPLFYSSIPVLVSWAFNPKRRVYSRPLTLDLILLKKRMPNGSVVYVSDLNRCINQWSFKNPNCIDNVAEFISEFRHYTKGGYFIANSQESSQVAKEIRMCFGSCINLLHHHHIGFVHWSEMRRITISEDLTATEQGNNDDKDNGNRANLFTFLKPFYRRYDTYAYYGRVADMDIDVPEPYQKANTNIFLKLPDAKQEKCVCETENSYTSLFKWNWLAFVLYTFVLLFLGCLFTLLAHNVIPLFIFLAAYIILL